MSTNLPILIRHVFVLSLILPSLAFIQVDENETYFPGTLDPCLMSYTRPCPHKHACRGYLSGTIRKCVVQRYNCLCVPYHPKYCSSSSECEPGNRCISFNSSSVCISCAATESVDSFAPVDIPPPSQCVSQAEDPTHAPFDPTEAPFISPIFYQDPTPTFYIPLASPEGSLPPFPSSQFPLPENSIEPSPEPSSSNHFPFRDEGYGFAMDRCSNDSECKYQYTCRSLEYPFLKCDIWVAYCQCLLPGPVLCSHRDQCLEGEFCVWSAFWGPKPDGPFAFCFSKKYVYYAYWLRLNFYPPEDKPYPFHVFNTSEREEFDITEATVTSREFSHSTQLELASFRSSYGNGNLGAFKEESDAENYHVDIDEPYTSSVPAPSYKVEPSFSSYLSYKRYFPSNDGITLDRCISVCPDGYICVDIYHEVPYALCDSSKKHPCLCFPIKGIKSCSSTFDCEKGEVCADPKGESQPYCISRHVVKRTDYFVKVDNLPSLEPPYPTFDHEYPSVEPEYEQLGLALETCLSHGDCALSYTCNSINSFKPCNVSFISSLCVCVPDKKDACIDSADCEDGEVCFPEPRIDIVPSFCISRSKANYLVWYSGLSPIVTRPILETSSLTKWTTWREAFRSSNREIGPGLTGDTCDTSSDCEERRVCCDIYNYGEECTSTLPGKKCFCYPTYYVVCVTSLQCDDGEVCTIVQGLHDDPYNHQSDKASPKSICLSQKAMVRNGYEENNTTAFPREIIDEVLYADAPKILEKTLQNAIL